MTPEAAAAVAAVLACLTGLPLALFDRQLIRILAGAGLAGSALGTMIWLSVPSEFWSHVLISVALSIAARYTACGDGDLLHLHWLLGVLGALTFVGIIFGEYHQTKFNSLHSMAHVVVFASAASISFTSGVEDAATTCSWAGMHTRERIKVARRVHDPLALCAIGTVLTVHRHDTQPIGLAFHSTLGYGLIALGIGSLLSSLVHTQLPSDASVHHAGTVNSVNAGAATTMRLLVAFLWLWNGAKSLRDIGYGPPLNWRAEVKAGSLSIDRWTETSASTYNVYVLKRNKTL